MSVRELRSGSIIRAHALVLIFLTLYTYVLAPAVAATGASSPAVKDDLARPALADSGVNATPPLKLVPPPPAEAPSPDTTAGATPPPASDAGGSSADRDSDAPPNASGVDLNYVLGPGDTLLILDYSSGDNNQPVSQPAAPILPDGTIDIHPIGIIKAAGLSLRELTDLVSKKAEKYIIKPDIQIVVIKVRPNTVYILGEVLKPGLYTNEAPPILGADPTVATSANLTVISALQKAGGIKEGADVRNIRITRLGSKEQTRVNLWQLLVEGDVSQDLPIIAGDVIYIPKGGTDFDPDSLGLAANQNRRVRIWGAVKAPGLLDMDPEDDILSVISKAGGFTPTATKSWVLLSRVNRDGTVSTRKISIKKGIRNPDTIARAHVKPGDLVIVHDSLLKKGANTLYQATIYFTYAIGVITYSIFLSQAVTSRGSGSGSGTAANPATVSVFAPPAAR